MSEPEKRLLTQDDMKIWETSQTREDLIQFITTLAEAVVGRENSQHTEPVSEEINATLSLIKEIEFLVEKHPVLSDTKVSRFGKVEFRDFYDDVKRSTPMLLQKTYQGLNNEQITQLATYLYESWGDRGRIDYGSGHELNFMCFLYGLTKYNILSLQRDSCNIVLMVFIEYLNLMRTLETLYWLEPAGSHGVWGLDDYHFLPFLFGAFQLSTHKHLKPISIHNDEVVEMFANRYLYFGCISFINSVKTTASLRWHSPMLDDISGVKRWSKVAEGMLKMYKAEVLGKLPIMQHFYFSEFLRCPEGVSPADLRLARATVGDAEVLEEVTHVHNTWGDCCGIRLPSAIAATKMNKGKHIPKPYPFD